MGIYLWVPRHPETGYQEQQLIGGIEEGDGGDKGDRKKMELTHN